MRKVDEFLRRVARRYVVTRRTYDGLLARHAELAADHGGLTARYDEVAAARNRLDADYAELLERYDKVAAAKDELEATYRTWTPPGHFYSPYPDWAEISTRADTIFDTATPPVAVELREADQLELFETLATLAAELPFSEERNGTHRYFFSNPEYSWSDGIILHTMLRHVRPRRVIEVGSGYSSMAMLDTVDGWLGGKTDLTFIEPNPLNLHDLLRPEDRGRVTILERAVQDVPMDRFTALAAGDLLFIDSTHVVKAGSDVNYLFFEVLPRLNDGVWVHVHDIFFPFEYPREWVAEGRAWQEAYLLRAFLMFNPRFEIRWYQQYMWSHHRDLLVSRVPEMARNSGGNIWLQKVPAR